RLGWRAASSTQAVLSAAVVAMVTTWATPAAAARSRTAGRSARNCSSSRCACVSIRVAAMSVYRGRGRSGVQCLQGGGVLLFHFAEPLQDGAGFRVGNRSDLAVQLRQRPLLVLGQDRQQVVERDKVQIREGHREGTEIGGDVPAALQEAGDARDGQLFFG